MADSIVYGFLFQNDFLNSDVELNPAVWLLGLIFCGLPLILAVMLLNLLRRHLRSRKEQILREKPPAAENDSSPDSSQE